MSKLVVANWKMNKTQKEAKNFCKEFLKKIPNKTNNFVICPPATLIESVALGLKNRGAVGAQNVFYAQSGAFTGEISPLQVLDAGAIFCLVGHSERRNYLGETDEICAKKVKFATENGLKVIFCVGEQLEERGSVLTVLKRQLKALAGVDLKNVIIAYEPVWAIGTGKVATAKDITHAHSIIKQIVMKEFNANISCLYGGSVKASNAQEILGLNEVDGILVGGASLDAQEFAELVKIGSNL